MVLIALCTLCVPILKKNNKNRRPLRLGEMARCQTSRGQCCRVFWEGELTGRHPWTGAAAEDLHFPPGLTVIRMGSQREEALGLRAC